MDREKGRERYGWRERESREKEKMEKKKRTATVERQGKWKDGGKDKSEREPRVSGEFNSSQTEKDIEAS